MADQFIGSYRVLKKIGAGGMAQVYLAVHQDVPNLKVVLKILSDPRLVERFRQEADKLALLDGNAHICQIKHFFNHGDDIVIAMEYINGITLDELVKQAGTLAADKALQIIGDVLETLDFAHKKGISHRDIKPSNIMVDDAGQVKIIDFGIAKGKTDPNLTVAGSSCGTPAYMAPEQFNPTDDTDYVRADIYAVGTTLFHMLTGRLPFDCDNQFALRDAKMFNDPARPTQFNPDISGDIEDIILKALQRDPDRRYGSAFEMKQAVAQVRGGSPRVDLTEEIRITSAPRASRPRPSRGGKIPLILISAAAVLMIFVYLFFIRGGAQPPDIPTLLTPAADAVVTTGTPEFTWQATAGDGGSYRVECALDDAFEFGIWGKTVTSTIFTPDIPMDNDRYFWRVRAVAADGAAGDFSAPRALMVAAPVVVTGNMALTITPRGDVYIDDELKGRDLSSFSIDLDAGEHIVRVENASSRQKTITDTLLVEAGGSVSGTFPFTFPAAPATPAAKPKDQTGKVIIGSRPMLHAPVIIDGDVHRMETPNTFPLTPGRHIITIRVTMDGVQREKTDTLVVKAGESYELWFDFDE